MDCIFKVVSKKASPYPKSYSFFPLMLSFTVLYFFYVGLWSISRNFVMGVSKNCVQIHFSPMVVAILFFDSYFFLEGDMMVGLE